MEQYTTDNPSFSNSISIPQTTDTNLADHFNVSTKQLLENTLVNANAIRNVGGNVGTTGFYDDGMDLTVVFADEIAKFTSPWAWIEDRLSCRKDGHHAPNLKGLNVRDYIPLEVNGTTLKMQIAGFDTYRDLSNNTLHPYIDFISKELYGWMEWITTKVGGLSDKPIDNNSHINFTASICESSIYDLLKTLYEDLPEELQKVIITKSEITEIRFAKDPLHPLTESTETYLCDLGKLWIPSEYEVFGTIIFGTEPYSAGSAKQYPIFSGNSYDRIKCFASPTHDTTSPPDWYPWWLSTPCSGSSMFVCVVGADGELTKGPVDYHKGFPICFRISSSG